jgi:signal transduction histidine kinase
MSLRSPRAWDLALAAAGAGALILDGLVSSPHDEISVAAYPLALVTAAPLVWRQRAPVGVLLATGAGLIACMAVFAPFHAAIPVAMVPLYTVAVTGDRRRSLTIGALAALTLGAAITVLEATGSLSEGSVRVFLALAALIIGDAVRTRRELRAAGAERAERVEREREQESRRRVTEERVRIARALHDTLAHALVAINVRAGVTAHLGQDSTAALTEIKQVSAEALRDLRSTLDLLREHEDTAPTRPAVDLAELPRLLDGARAGGLKADADVRLNGTAIPSSIGQAGYRIVQESLTNVLRHAHAQSAHVDVRIVDHALEITVVDDGRGSGAGSGTKGHGLRGMAERTAALGGQVVAGPCNEGGWRVLARLPLKVSSAADE